PKQPSILGQRPQAYATSSQTSKDIKSAMHTMSLHTPDNQWYTVNVRKTQGGLMNCVGFF
ncbi:hypothetical protein A2U01_0112407, partial [Trifolium medium]|nr:hypothetical protein [Trifolium medium]